MPPHASPVARYLPGSSFSLRAIVELSGHQILYSLGFPRGPTDDRLLNLRILTQPEMQPAVVLGGESASTGNLLQLVLAVPVKSDLRTDRTVVAGGADKRKFQPLVPRSHRVLVDQQRAALVRHHYIENPAVPQVSHGDRSPVVDIVRTNRLGYIDEFSCPIVDPHFLLLLAG